LNIISTEIYTAYADDVGMLLYINRKFTIENIKYFSCKASFFEP
jgi:hypothetical protein